MSGNKQTLIVKQTREVSATTLHTDNLHSGWSTLTGNNQTGGGTLLNCWTTKELWCDSLWYEREKLCPLSVILPSDKAAWQLRLRLLGGWPIPSACQHPLWPAGWLRCWGQTGHCTPTDIWLRLSYVHSWPEALHWNALQPSFDLLAGFGKDACNRYHTPFPYRGETPWKLVSTSYYSPHLKIIQSQRARCHLWVH